jgi:hypothetical protein
LSAFRAANTPSLKRSLLPHHHGVNTLPLS